MRVRYSAMPLNRRRLLREELNNNFADLEDGINAGVSDHDFLAAQIQHRHLAHPLSVPLERSFFSYPLSPHISNVGWVSDSGVGNYYLVENSILELIVPHTGLANRTESNMPVAHVKAIINQCDANPLYGHNLIEKYTIGVSHDEGATWVPKEKCSRPSLYTAGAAWAYFFAGQKHYLTGANWQPPSIPLDRGLVLLASLGGALKTTNSNGNVWVAVMASHWDLGSDGRMWGEIELNARWATEVMA